jgi:hypothetical protein
MRHLIRMTTAALLVSLCSAALATSAGAQTLDGMVRIGQTIAVTDEAGSRAKGQLLALDASSLTIEVPPSRNPTGRLTIALPTINRIVKHDGVLNGFLLGLGAGVATAVGFVRYHCGPPGFDRECSAIATLVSWGFVPVGAATGSLIDGLINKTIYTRGGGPTIRISPQLGRHRVGASINVRF